MPVYEYRCTRCANLFEKLVPMSANGSQVDCPTCGDKAEKLLSIFATHGTERPTSGGGCCGGGGGCACAG